MAKMKNGRKPKAIKDHEKEMVASTYRPGRYIEALSTDVGDAQGTIKQDERLTAAEIAWRRIVCIARGDNDSLALEASKFLIERSYGKMPAKAESNGDQSFTVIIK